MIRASVLQLFLDEKANAYLLQIIGTIRYNAISRQPGYHIRSVWIVIPMYFLRKISIVLILFGTLLLALVHPVSTSAFPLRLGEDCFYGTGDPSEKGLSTWMGYAVKFTPPYAPYTVDGISIYINQMGISDGTEHRIRVSVLDSMGVLGQSKEVDWHKLANHKGWVLIDLADHTYNGQFTVIVNSGVGLVSPTATFMLGVDQSDPVAHSFVYTSIDPPSPPPTGTNAQKLALEQGVQNYKKLVPVSTGLPGFKGGNWMIRAQAPGLQVETTRVTITMDDIAKLHEPPKVPTPPASRSWTMPPIEGSGPRGCVHCPTSLAGITFYDYQSNDGKKFLIPQNGPWINPDLAYALGDLCRDLSREGVVGIEHIGIYNNRNIEGTNTRSSHAYGLGIDISGFQFSDGKVIEVEDHNDPVKRSVLEHFRDSYLKKHFTTVLDWHYQRHNNHFHVNLPYNP
jgi:hypothetical protein